MIPYSEGGFPHAARPLSSRELQESKFELVRGHRRAAARRKGMEKNGKDRTAEENMPPAPTKVGPRPRARPQGGDCFPEKHTHGALAAAGDAPGVHAESCTWEPFLDVNRVTFVEWGAHQTTCRMGHADACGMY